MNGPNAGRPVVYGDVESVVVIVESVTRLVDRQPVEVLADPVVNGSLRRLHDATGQWLRDDVRDSQTSNSHAQPAGRQTP